MLNRIVSVILICLPLLYAEENARVRVSGWGWLTMGQVKKSEYMDLPYYNVDFNEKPLADFQAGVKLTAPLFSRTVFKIHIMSSYVFPVVTTTYGADYTEVLQKSFSFSLLEASSHSNWNISDGDTISVEFGYFPVKYNPEAMNLGEYLFRSNTYPGILVNGFEVADRVKLLGVRAGYINNTSSGRYKADVFINTETDLYPTRDISLSVLAGYTMPNTFIDFSAGLYFHHFIPFDRKRVTPAKVSTFNPYSQYFVDSTGDTTDYTFRGTKTAARITFDPKVFFKSGILGENDLKVYGEAAILGIKDYPGWYNDIFERMPVMFGVNLPAFKLLDVLALEVEYYRSPYENTIDYWRSGSPVPVLVNNMGVDYYSNWKPKKDDDWKWSIYGSKTIKNFRLSGQIASDHTNRSIYMVSGKKVYTEMCRRTNDWYYMLRCGFYF